MTACAHSKYKARNYNLEVDRECAVSFLLSLLNCCQILIWTISQFSSFWLYTHAQWTWNKTTKMWMTCRYSVLIFKVSQKRHLSFRKSVISLHSISIFWTEKYWTTTKQMKPWLCPHNVSKMSHMCDTFVSVSFH